LLEALDPSSASHTFDLAFACGALFLVPICADSALSPILADLASPPGRATGPASGLVYGISTAGNIAGILLAAGDTWHRDEVFLRIRGQRRYLWRAVDQHGTVLDLLVQSRRSARAAKRPSRSCSRACGTCPA
jgi:hypothetical protein